MAYCTLDDVKAVLGKVKTDDDAWLSSLCDVATDFVRLWTGREFQGGASGTKTYSGNDELTLPVDDLLTLTGVTIDGVDQTDLSKFVLVPLNVTPHRWIRRKEQEPWPETDFANVTITGTWGFSTTVPTVVSQATAMIAAGVFQTSRGSSAFTNKGFQIDRSMKNEIFQFGLSLLEPYRDIH